jgi:hypothetical protein
MLPQIIWILHPATVSSQPIFQWWNIQPLNYEGTLPNGVLEFDSIYPIRGQYTLRSKLDETLHLSFKDNHLS